MNSTRQYSNLALFGLRCSLCAVLSAGCGSPPTKDRGPEVGGELDSGNDADSGAEVGASAAPKSWRSTASMHVARARHSTVLLPSGKVVVMGGERPDGTQIASVEVYDPATETWTEAADLPASRGNHTATMLNDGRILIVGGGGSSMVGVPPGLNVTGTALLMDPSTLTVTAAGSLKVARGHHQAALLPSGKVLVFGGATASAKPNTTKAPALASAEIYDPATDTWSNAGSMVSPRFAAASAVLKSGKVLVLGGAHEEASWSSAEVFDPATGSWSATGSMKIDRIFASTTVLESGRVLVACGKKANVAFLGSSELFDEAASAWSPLPTTFMTSTLPGLIALPGEQALLVGGNYCDQNGCTRLKNAAVFDGTSQTWTAIEPLAKGRTFHTVTRLMSGEILVVGGIDEQAAPLTSVERSKAEWTSGPPTQNCLPYKPIPAPKMQAGYLGTGVTAPPNDQNAAFFWSAASFPSDEFRVHVNHHSGIASELVLPVQRTFTAQGLNGTCDVCVTFRAGCDGTSCTRYMFATGGTITVTEATKSAAAGHFTASGTDLRLLEWTFLRGKGVDEPVPNGQCLLVPKLDIDLAWP